jgi:hypothetical protein
MVTCAFFKNHFKLFTGFKGKVLSGSRMIGEGGGRLSLSVEVNLDNFLRFSILTHD